MSHISIHVEKDKVYFIYQDTMQAGDACVRLIHLDPHICSRNGYLNAVVVDMDKVEPMGEA